MTYWRVLFPPNISGTLDPNQIVIPHQRNVEGCRNPQYQRQGGRERERDNRPQTNT